MKQVIPTSRETLERLNIASSRPKGKGTSSFWSKSSQQYFSEVGRKHQAEMEKKLRRKYREGLGAGFSFAGGGLAPSIPPDLAQYYQANPLPSGWYGPYNEGGRWKISSSNVNNATDYTQAIQMWADAYSGLPIQAVYPGNIVVNYDASGNPSTVLYKGKSYSASAMGLGETPMAKSVIPAGSNVVVHYNATGKAETVTWQGKDYPASQVGLADIVSGPGERSRSGLSGFNWGALAAGLGGAVVGAGIVAASPNLASGIDSGANAVLGGLKWAGGTLISAPSSLLKALTSTGASKTGNSADIIHLAQQIGVLTPTAVKGGNVQALQHVKQGTLGMSPISSEAGVFGLTSNMLGIVLLAFTGISIGIFAFRGKGK